MEILDDDAIVEAETLGTVITTVPLYDPSTDTSNGCDPVGCIGALTRVSRARLDHFRPGLRDYDVHTEHK